MTRWIVAAGLLVGGLVVGSILARVARRMLGRDGRPEAVRSVAPLIASFVFWLGVALGIVFSVSMVSPESLENIPSHLVAYFPKVLVAGIIVIGGNVLGVLAGLAVGRGFIRATGERKPAVERAVRAGVLVLAVVLGVAQLGVNTTVVNLLLAALLFGLAASAALLIGLGGRDVARHVAAGRYLRGVVHPGDRLELPDVTGVVVKVTAAGIEVTEADGTSVHVPHGRVLDDVVRLRRGDG